MADVVDKRLVDLRPDLPRRQSADAPPVVVNRDLPAMAAADKVKAEPKKAGQILMDAKVPFLGAGKDRMTQVPKTTTTTQPARLKPQEPLPTATKVATDGYVRLELHVEDGKLSVVGAHEVEGPLTIPTAVIQGHAYEVLAGDRRISLGSIPDTVGRHAFANANVAGPQSKHYFIPETTFNFFARIPKAEMRPEVLPEMSVVLHRVGTAPDKLSAVRLAKHPGVETVELARLPGLTLDQLPQQVRPQFERILKENEQKK